jgi:hypothetical protein
LTGFFSIEISSRPLSRKTQKALPGASAGDAQNIINDKQRFF